MPEADFGHIHVDFPTVGGSSLLAAWAYSNAPFVIALPCEAPKLILHGMVAAFEFFGAVAKEVRWDNPKTVATPVLKGAMPAPPAIRLAGQSLRLRSPLLHARGATRSPMPRGPSRPCRAASPPPCPAWLIATS